jgi:hypothetical protein
MKPSCSLLLFVLSTGPALLGADTAAPATQAEGPAPATAAAAAADSPALFSTGSRLIYTVSGGKVLVIDILHYPARTGPVTFRYRFSNLGPDGTVTLTPAALKNATALHNYFGSGDESLNDQTSVWLSQKVFAAAKAGEPVTLNLGADGKATFKLDPDGGGFMPLSIDTQRYGDLGAIGTILLRSEDGKSIRVHDDADSPLIVEMDTGSFVVRLALHL